MTNEMMALSKERAEPGLWMTRAPVPEIGPDDVLIKVHKTGICGTDIHIWNWDDWAAKTVPVPMITGHEFAGEIVELGRNVTDLTLGQRCSGEGHLIGKNSRQSRAGLLPKILQGMSHVGRPWHSIRCARPHSVRTLTRQSL